MTDRFATTLDCADISFIADGTLDELPLPPRIGATRTGGIDLNKPRIRVVDEIPARTGVRRPGGCSPCRDNADSAGTSALAASISLGRSGPACMNLAFPPSMSRDVCSRDR